MSSRTIGLHTWNMSSGCARVLSSGLYLQDCRVHIWYRNSGALLAQLRATLGQ